MGNEKETNGAGMQALCDAAETIDIGTLLNHYPGEYGRATP